MNAKYTIEDVINNSNIELKKYIDDDIERMSQIKYILTGLMDVNYSELNKKNKEFIDIEIYIKYIKILEEIKLGKPVQYALGYAAFYGNEFIVNENVLIPRQETEELVNWILSDFKNKQNISILDIGTGSGNIAITIKKNHNDWEVYGSDISNKALKVAIKNNELHRTDVSFIKSDLFENIKNKFDIIVSNPPYISINEKQYMDKTVLDYEPDGALFAKNNGLLIYEKINKDILKYLNNNGKAYFEIGYNQGQYLCDMFNKLDDVNVELRKDMSGHDRMIKITRK